MMPVDEDLLASLAQRTDEQHERRDLPDQVLLDYAPPRLRRSARARHVAALAYAAIAIPIGVLFLLLAGLQFHRAMNENTAWEVALERRAGLRFLACGVLLVGSGGWYGLAGLRKW